MPDYWGILDTEAPCATEGCENIARYHFEAGDVGSKYCTACKIKIDQQMHPPIDPVAAELLRFAVKQLD